MFSPIPFLGNPVAVVLVGADLDEQDMQRLARWTNLSETTFVLPPTTAGADYRLRIWTPGGELPFAGHPTLGSAHAWLEHGGIPAAADRVVQECAAGLIPVLREPDPESGRENLSFAAPPTVRTGPLEDDYLNDVLEAFGISPDQVLAHQWVDNGPGWAVLQLPTATDVLALEPDLTRIPDAMVGAIGAHPAGSDHLFEMRTFAPGIGVDEDPVCGSMNASVAQWLTATGVVAGSYRVSQGGLGRAGVTPRPSSRRPPPRAATPAPTTASSATASTSDPAWLSAEETEQPTGQPVCRNSSNLSGGRGSDLRMDK